MSERSMKKNWECPIDGKVYRSAMAAFTHIYRSDLPRHGEENSIVVDSEVVFPELTEDDVTENTVEDGLDLDLNSEVEELIKDLEDTGYKVPPLLDQQDIESFHIVDVHRGFRQDIDLLKSQIKQTDDIVSNIIKNMDQIETDSSVEEIEPEPESEDEDEEEDDSGRYSTADMKEREEEQVFSVIERSVLFDDYSDHMFDIFKYVYENRDKTDNITIPEIADKIGVPDGAAEDDLDALASELYLISHDEEDDSFYVPY